MRSLVDILRSKLDQGLCSDDSERIAHLRLVEQFHEGGGLRIEHEVLYRDLTILDDKSSALLSFNSIILAAAAILLTSAEAVARIGFLITLFVIGVSSYLCLRVVWLRWSDTRSMASHEQFWLDLHPVRDQRTRWFRGAWMLAQVAIVGLVASAVLDSFGL